jgi:hypothetical protein
MGDAPTNGGRDRSAADSGQRSDDASISGREVARDLAQEQVRESPRGDWATDSRAERWSDDVGVRDSAPRPPRDASRDSSVEQDSGARASLCPGQVAVCDGMLVDTFISSLHCGGCTAPCGPGDSCEEGVCQPAGSDWSTLQRDVRHSGESPDKTAVPSLCLSWSVAIDPGVALSPVVAEGGRLFVTSARSYGPHGTVYALAASDGGRLWQHDFGDVFSVGWPSAFSGSVYVANGVPGDGAGPPLLWALDAAAGDTQWVAKLTAQRERYWPALRVGDVVYTNAGTYGGIFGFSAKDGAQIFGQALDQYDQWSPTYFDGHLFTYVGGKLRKHDLATGATLATVAVPFTSTTHSMQTTAVFGDTLAYVIAPPSLVAVDPTNNAIVWTAQGSFAGLPATAGGVVYASSAGTLEARDGSTGTLLWTFPGDGALSYPPVVVDGHVYVASDKNVFAIEIASRAQIWTDSVGGWLSLAAYRLFVASADGVLWAYRPSSF